MSKIKNCYTYTDSPQVNNYQGICMETHYVPSQTISQNKHKYTSNSSFLWNYQYS
uniref:Uncharacterized protein n=1 Tax=Anguilla anguilla TaxID=7936 RepID=A0A0E9Q1E8_ANGAN